MGIANREYYRESTPPPWMMGQSPVVVAVIAVTVVVFLLQILTTRNVERSPKELLEELRRRDPKVQLPVDDPSLDQLPAVTVRVSAVTDWFDLDPNKVLRQGQVWRLLTHAFCHDRFGLWHILFNMLFLYWFGREIESLYGSREFLLFYLTAAVASGLAYVGLDLYLGTSVPAVGASGAVLGVTMLFTLHYPRHELLLFFILPLQMRWVMTLYLIWDLHPVLLALAGDPQPTGVAHAGHLGGLAFGFLYYRFQLKLDRFRVRVPNVRGLGRAPRPRLRIAPGTHRETGPAVSPVDQLLDKISREGPQSLSPEEKAVLRAESERIRNRNR